jgi:hypothetical protein
MYRSVHSSYALGAERKDADSCAGRQSTQEDAGELLIQIQQLKCRGWAHEQGKNSAEA